MKEHDLAHCGSLTPDIAPLVEALDEYLKFNHKDALARQDKWQQQLNQTLPTKGIGIEKTIDELCRWVIPNGSAIPNPGCTSFITTGATSAGALSSLASAVAAPQRLGLHAFNFLEALSLDWLKQLFGLPGQMQGIYSSGGSTANLLALGAARESAYGKVALNTGEDGITRPGRIYASEHCHRTIQRAAGCLGLGRNSVCLIPADHRGRLQPEALIKAIKQDQHTGVVPVAIVANAGSTSVGAIDPIAAVVDIAKQYDLWLHIDGAYGLPGILDPDICHLYEGLDQADSVIADPHKWLGAPVGIGATFVRNPEFLMQAFTQGESDYLDCSIVGQQPAHSLDDLGTPYFDMGVELSAPSRGAVVWSILREIGRDGLQQRVCRHNAMARHIASRVKAHPKLELLTEPTLSICCFRYTDSTVSDLNTLNRNIHRTLIHNGINMPSTAVVNNQLAIRPCFIGARTELRHADALVDEVIAIGDQMTQENP